MRKENAAAAMLGALAGGVVAGAAQPASVLVAEPAAERAAPAAQTIPNGAGWGSVTYATGQSGRCGLRSTGAMVRSWQSILWADGLYGSWSDVDGVFGPATTQQTKIFQGRYGAKVDGCPGWQTWSKAMSGLRLVSSRPNGICGNVYKYQWQGHDSRWIYWEMWRCDSDPGSGLNIGWRVHHSGRNKWYTMYTGCPPYSNTSIYPVMDGTNVANIDTTVGHCVTYSA